MAMTWASLRALWDERDNRYRDRKAHGRRLPVTPAEEQSIRLYRQTEVAMLAATERPLAVSSLNGWMPPRGMA